MTNDQADWLYELAHRDGDEQELREMFPDVDWAGVEQRRQDRLMIEAAARAATGPKPLIGIEDIDRVLRERLVRDAIPAAFLDSPLLTRLKK